FFFQAEDGIRDLIVTGVQTCALPIYSRDGFDPLGIGQPDHGDLGHPLDAVDGLLDFAAGDVLAAGLDHVFLAVDDADVTLVIDRSEERRVGKECRSWWVSYH